MKSIFALSIIIATTVLNSCSGDDKQAKKQQQPPMPVPVATAIQKTVKLTETYTGRFTATEKVEVRSTVLYDGQKMG